MSIFLPFLVILFVIFEYLFSQSIKLARVTVGASNAKLVTEVFWMHVEFGKIKEHARTFYLVSSILRYVYNNKWTKENQNSWDDHCEEIL